MAVYIIGGGLAAMTIAKELAQNPGFSEPLTILEASARMGGKAGAESTGGAGAFEHDHGYHIFPPWYPNTLKLLAAIGAASNLKPISRVHYLKKDGYPRLYTFYGLVSLKAMWKNLVTGLIPVPEMILAAFYTWDLAGQQFKRRAYLDRVSASGFLRSRIYATEALAELNYHFVLQASSIPFHKISAMTLRKVAGGWYAKRDPMFSILRGGLHSHLIQPFENHLRRLGVKLLTDTAVDRIETDGVRVVRLHLRGTQSIDIARSDSVVLATPQEQTRKFVNDDIAIAETRTDSFPDDAKLLSGLAQLESVPMAALHLHIGTSIPDLPEEHVILFDSKYEISFIDIKPHWNLRGVPGHVLSVIASDFNPLSTLSKQTAKNMILAEIDRYIPGLSSKVTAWHLAPNTEVPLFLNSVGSWHFRPATRTRIDQLWIAGDYCRSHVDLTTMESAVDSGLATAAGILTSKGIKHNVRPQECPMPPKSVLWLGWLLGIGPVILLRVYLWMVGRAERPLNW